MSEHKRDQAKVDPLSGGEEPEPAQPLQTVPPGAKAKAHKHEAHETAIYTLSGQVGMWYGERLENHMTASAGDFVYIPANVPHLPYNLSQTEPAVAVVARTDPNEQESVVMLPELDAIHG